MMTQAWTFRERTRKVNAREPFARLEPIDSSELRKILPRERIQRSPASVLPEESNSLLQALKLSCEEPKNGKKTGQLCHELSVRERDLESSDTIV